MNNNINTSKITLIMQCSFSKSMHEKPWKQDTSDSKKRVNLQKWSRIIHSLQRLLQTNVGMHWYSRTIL